MNSALCTIIQTVFQHLALVSVALLYVQNVTVMINLVLFVNINVVGVCTILTIQKSVYVIGPAKIGHVGTNYTLSHNRS